MSSSRISLDRLRERTDELELLISGLSLLGLLALPDVIGDAYVDNYARLPIAVLAGVAIGSLA